MVSGVPSVPCPAAATCPCCLHQVVPAELAGKQQTLELHQMHLLFYAKLPSWAVV